MLGHKPLFTAFCLQQTRSALFSGLKKMVLAPSRGTMVPSTFWNDFVVERTDF